jgi:TPR repeat protein
MSSPLDRDFGPDEPSPYAPKWVRDAADARRGRAAEQREIAPKAPENLEDEDFRRPAANPAASNEPVLVDRYRLPPSLEPTLMPAPWPVPRTRSALGLLMRFTVAAGIAAVVALFVVGKVPMSWLIAGKAEKQDSPSFGLRFSGQNAGTAERPNPAAAQLTLSQEGPRKAREAFPPGVKLTRAVEGATAAQAAGSPAAQAAADPATQPPAGPVTQPQASPAAQPPAGAAKSFPIRQLDREEIADLVHRGEAFIAAGDLASARLVLQRAAEGGDPRAALMLAGTYDPIVLEKLGIQGFASDIAAARTWYERAKEFGSAEAMRRLEMLASRAR